MTLSRQGDFERVFRLGTRIGGDAFTVLGHRNGLAHARLGLAVSRRSAARAVDRNRLKRVARESFRAHATRLAGIDVVVLARTGATAHANGELRDSLDRQYLALQEQCATS